MSTRDRIHNQTHLVLSSVALIFCLVWAFIGTSDIKIVAVTISFIYFLHAAIATEMASIASH